MDLQKRAENRKMLERLLRMIVFALLLAGTFPEARSMSGEPGAEKKGSMSGDFRFPKLNFSHRHMRLLLENAFGYVNPKHGVIDPASGYPVEGWNQDPHRGLHLRSFTQLTAIGEWVELLANIVAGYAGNPYISRDSAMEKLSLAIKSLREDQENPTLAAKGLLVNFLGLEGERRTGPLLQTVERDRFIETFGEKTGSGVWKALLEKGWILPERKGRTGRIRRGEKYGASHFDGPLAPFAKEPLKSSIMGLLDQRTALVIFGDNVNLSSSMAKAVGALLRPEVKDDPRVSGLREEMERFIAVQKAGYAHLLDKKTGTFFFGWDATADRMVGWDDGQGNWVSGQMNSFISEFRGPWVFTVLRHGLPETSIRNAGFKIKPYRLTNGRDSHSLAAWEGSTFQLLGLSLFMQEHLNPGWKRSLESIVDIALDYSGSRGLPGFLSEAYSGNGTEYTGYIGIPEIAITDKPLITHAPSLYTLGVAYTIAPEKIEKFLEAHWRIISGLFTDHGPWEGYNTSTREVIEFQTTAHTLALILGGIGSSHENMDRYLKLNGLSGALERLYKPGKRVDLLSPGNRVTGWAMDQCPVRLKKKDGFCSFESQLTGAGGLTFTVSEARGTSLSNGTLRIRYQSEEHLEDAHILFKRFKEDPFPTPPIPIEVFTRFKKTQGKDEETEIVLPATPALNGIKEISLVFGRSGIASPVDVVIKGFDFTPFPFALGCYLPLRSLRILARPEESCCFLDAEEHIHVLNRTAGLSLDQIVDHADHDQPACPLVHIQEEIAEVASPNVRGGQQPARTENP
jgi:hypothetical protein